MSGFPQPSFEVTDIGVLAAVTGTIVVVVSPDGALDRSAKRVDRLTRGALSRLVAGRAFPRLDTGGVAALDLPGGMQAERLLVAKLDRRSDAQTVRCAGAGIASKLIGGQSLRIETGGLLRPVDLFYGLALRSYAYTAHKTGEGEITSPSALVLAANKVDGLAEDAADRISVARGVHLARDLTNAPSNQLNTTRFAASLQKLEALGVTVEVLDEAELEARGLRLLLAVGRGSRQPTKLVILRWNGAEADTAPLALIGKGVTFDSGGISLKPADGMEEMTVDMGGAGVVAGAMHALAAREAKAHVVGLVGLAENMPDGDAQRPGDVVASMKGDTVEVINTDAEGRLVLADVMWYAQERFNPAAMVELSTLTGSIVIALGHEMAGGFSNNDGFWQAFEQAAEAEGDPVWRMPLGPGYRKALKSRVADMANVGGRSGGAVIAAEFLRNFVRDDTPWIHLDIAGVASMKTSTTFAPAGATGWGVRAIDRLVRDMQEG